MKKVVAIILLLFLILTVIPAFAQETTVRGGTITAGKVAVFSLDPTHPKASIDDRGILIQIYEPLIDFDEKGNLVPRLAKEWTMKDDSTIVFTLRDDVVFHDGEKFNAQAVKTAFDYYMSEECSPTWSAYINKLESVEVLDEYTVQFNLSEPSASFLSALADNSGLIVSPDVIENHKADMATYAKGTGPFMVEEYIEGDTLTLVRNPNYYELGTDGQPLPYLDKVIIKIITDNSVLTTNLRSGDIDIGDNISISNLEILASDPNIKIVETAAKTCYVLFMNNQKAPLDNVKVRQAISYAVDRQQLSDVITLGHGVVAPFIITPEQWFYSEVGAYSTDLEKARTLLAEAGYPDGFSIDLTCISRDPDNLIVQILQAQLAQIGITATIDTMERTAWVNMMSAANKDTGAVLGVAKGTMPRTDAYTQFNVFFSATATDNYSRYYSDDYDTLINQLETTYETGARKAICAELQALILGDAACVPLYQQPKFAAESVSLKGIAYDFAGVYIFKNAYLAK